MMRLLRRCCLPDVVLYDLGAGTRVFFCFASKYSAQRNSNAETCRVSDDDVLVDPGSVFK
jgi:hypothetical protein